MGAKPTTIITGFLGAGKTTYLNYLLKQNEHKRYAIIENEFGAQGIDSELIIRPEQGIVELNNGCLCCTIHDSLYEILNTLFDRKEEFEEVIIEATGVADPSGLAAPFVSHPAIKKWFPISSIVCLVDAELILAQLKETEEALNQITYSDVLLINKTDLVDATQLEKVTAKLKALNPLAKIVLGNKDSFPEIDFSRHEGLFHALSLEDQQAFPVDTPHHHHHHSHTEEVISHTFTFDRPFNYQALHHQLTVHLTLQAKDLYRMKGLLWIADSDQQQIMQSVGKRLDFQEKRAWKAHEQKQSTIVLIGKNLKRPGYEKMLTRCLA